MVAVINPIQNLQTVYISMYGRPADPIGLAFWNKATSNGTNLAPMVEFFAVSPEFVSLFGPAFAPNAPVAPSANDIQVAINQVYQQAFGRDADPAGLTYWTEQILSGKVNATEFAMIIVQEAQPADAAVVAAKLGTADSFTASINTTQEMLQYPTDAGLDAGRAFLAPVVSVATQPTQAQIDAQLALIAAGDVATGQTFTLTTGVDTFTGTAGNDTFQAELEFGASTITTFDNINGAGGLNTLNIVGNGGDINANATFANIQVVNVDVAGPITNLNSASFGGVQQLWQIGNVNNVTVGAGVVAGFRNVETSNGMNVTVNGAQSASVAFDTVTEGQGLIIDGSSGTTLNSVNISGTVVDGSDLDTDVGITFVDVVAGRDVQSLSVNSAVNTDLAVSSAFGSTNFVTTVDASASAGNITITQGGVQATVAAISTGSGADDVVISTATSKTVGSVVNASVNTNAGNDNVLVSVIGDGSTTVNTGVGDDTVAVANLGTGVLNVSLGAGSDSFNSDRAITKADTIDAGDGVDTLQLSLVGSSNAVAFSNFEVVDVNGMLTSLDLDFLAPKNIVGEIIGSGALGSNVTLQKVGAGVNVRATADMGPNVLSIEQKTAGAFTVTLDADEAVADIDQPADAASISVVAEGATSVSAVFDTAYQPEQPNEMPGNVSTINLTTKAAESISVVSGGALAQNVLNINGSVVNAVAESILTTVTVSGDQALVLSSVDAPMLGSIDASTHTGGLTASLADLKNGGNISLGSGTDTITADNTSTFGQVERVTGFEKAAAVAVSTAIADVDAKNAAIESADTLVLSATANVAADDVDVLAGWAIDNGVLVFTSANGPGTIEEAIAIVDSALIANEVVVFQYNSQSFIFEDGGVAADTLVDLVGVTGVTHLAETGPTSSQFFIV